MTQSFPSQPMCASAWATWHRTSRLSSWTQSAGPTPSRRATTTTGTRPTLRRSDWSCWPTKQGGAYMLSEAARLYSFDIYIKLVDCIILYKYWFIFLFFEPPPILPLSANGEKEIFYFFGANRILKIYWWRNQLIWRLILVNFLD